MADHSRMEDAELVATARAAHETDTRAFEQLVKRHEGHVVTNCRYMTRAPADAEDLAQEVFLKAFFALRRFEARASFKGWIQRIKVNHCLDFIKKRKGKSFVDVEDPSLSQAPELSVAPQAERRASAADDRRRIGEVLDAMSETLRVPLVMRDLDKMSYDEIAASLGIGLSAVKMRIKRAREEFRRMFELEGGVGPAGVGDGAQGSAGS